MKPEPQEISPQKALAEVAAAVPVDIHQNIIIIGSLAAGYGKNGKSRALLPGSMGGRIRRGADRPSHDTR